MRLSVVVCTYQGEAWIVPQLASIAGQTRAADEIVVRDDCSPDGTLAQVRQALQQISIESSCTENTTNLGCTCNFAAAIADASGDVIVLADQDDIWRPHKLSVIEQKLEATPQAGFAFSNAALVDERLLPLEESLWDRLGVTRGERRAMRQGNLLASLLRRNLVTGATMAFRSKYRDLILPIPSTWVHDAWIAVLISAVAPCVAIDEPLIQYRQHAQQQIGERRRGWYGQYLVARQMGRDYFYQTSQNYALAAERLRGQSRYAVSQSALRALDAKVLHWQRRGDLRSTRIRLPRIAAELFRGDYGRYSLGWKAIAQDLFL